MPKKKKSQLTLQNITLAVASEVSKEEIKEIKTEIIKIPMPRNGGKYLKHSELCKRLGVYNGWGDNKVNEENKMKQLINGMTCMFYTGLFIGECDENELDQTVVNDWKGTNTKSPVFFGQFLTSCVTSIGIRKLEERGINVVELVKNVSFSSKSMKKASDRFI